MIRPEAIRLFVCDIDGTLVRRDKSLSDGNVAAVKRLTQMGLAVTLISARPISGIIHLAERLMLEGPFGAFNGGTLFDLGGADGVRTIGNPERIAPQVAETLLAIYDAAKIDTWLFAQGQWFTRNPDNPHIPREILSSRINPTIRDDLTSVRGSVDKIVGVSDDADLLRRLEHEALAATATRATVALSQSYFLDATGPDANKGDGLAAIAASMRIPLEQVAVIGDMANDLPMFARAGLSIAMGQAPDQVRSAADWVSASNEDDGVARAIDRLIRERRDTESRFPFRSD